MAGRNVTPAGLEPATSSLGNLRSIQLNYEVMFAIARGKDTRMMAPGKHPGWADADCNEMMGIANE